MMGILQKLRRRDGRKGQTLLFLLMVLVILSFVVLWNFDLHKILHVKALSQNAGDSAALMAARWQGISLNLVGDLNILHAVALAADDQQAAGAITNIQARLCYVGPMIAFAASQQAAKNNGIYRNPDFDALLIDHAQTVRNDYPRTFGPDGEPLFPEPYEGCWEEYAGMLEAIASDGCAAGPDNARFYGDHVGGHYLLMIDFYDAIAGRTWCWFYHNAPELLPEYTNFHWWPPLPEIPHAEYINSEIYSLGLRKVTTDVNGLVSVGVLASNASLRGLDTAVNAATSATWYAYQPGAWGPWGAMQPPFPVTGTVRPEYDYAGADASVRIETETSRLTPGPRGVAITNDITWSAAAKPFGFLGEADVPMAYDLVIPAFHEVRLIPVDASSAPSGGGFNLAWRRHIEEHLPEYMQHGPTRTDCWYCLQLATWEIPAFRLEGEDWLAEYSDRCTITGGGGGGHRGGGTRRGH